MVLLPVYDFQKNAVEHRTKILNNINQNRWNRCSREISNKSLKFLNEKCKTFFVLRTKK